VQAFEQAGRKPPIIEGGGSSNFLKWWSEQFKKDGYKTVSDNSAPGIGGAAFWLTLAILNGAKAEPSKTMFMPYATSLPIILLSSPICRQDISLAPNTRKSG
jgi:ribose transport system substrate-binding protein